MSSAPRKNNRKTLNFFLVPCYGHLFTILANFWVKIAVWIKPPCVYTCKNRLNMKCPSSSPLNFDDFPFFLNLCSSSGTRVRTFWSWINICQILSHLHDALPRHRQQLRRLIMIPIISDGDVTGFTLTACCRSKWNGWWMTTATVLM